MPTTYEYLDPVALSRLKNLSLAARKVVEGYFAGMHRKGNVAQRALLAVALGEAGDFHQHWSWRTRYRHAST